MATFNQENQKVETQINIQPDETAASESSLNDLLCAFDELLKAAIEYRDYEYDGDPWAEDARAMGEMTLDDMKRDGRLEKYQKILAAFNADT